MQSSTPPLRQIAERPPSPEPVRASSTQLADASRALWLATLALMTAYLQATGPAHRLLLARRIARNFRTLADQAVFADSCRATFLRLANRWDETAATLGAPTEAVRTASTSAWSGWLRRLSTGSR